MNGMLQHERDVARTAQSRGSPLQEGNAPSKDSTLVLRGLLRCGKVHGPADPSCFAYEPIQFFPTIRRSLSIRLARVVLNGLRSGQRLASDSTHGVRRLRDEMILHGLRPCEEAHPRVSSGSCVLDVVDDL